MCTHCDSLALSILILLMCLPAFDHETIDASRAARWWRQSIARVNFLDYLQKIDMASYIGHTHSFIVIRYTNLFVCEVFEWSAS